MVWELSKELPLLKENKRYCLLKKSCSFLAAKEILIDHKIERSMEKIR